MPFKTWTLLTELANIALLVQIARRVTGSALAGFLAPILWTANAGLALAVGWSSAYNEIAFAFVILLAFRLFLQCIDAGVLELNVADPALAAGYALCCARPYFRKTLFLFISSALFIAAHFAFIAAPADPHYKMYFGSSALTMLWTYWAYTLSAPRMSRLVGGCSGWAFPSRLPSAWPWRFSPPSSCAVATGCRYSCWPGFWR